MPSTLPGKEAETAGTLYEIYLEGQPENGNAWNILRRAADKIKAAKCTIIYSSVDLFNIMYQVHKDDVNPIDISSEEFRDLGCKNWGPIKAEDWVAPENPEPNSTAE